MSATLVLWLPPVAALGDGDAPDPAWLRVDDGVIVDSGQDDGWVDAWEKPQSDDADDRLIALAPACDVPLRWLSYPEAAPAQAMAAARIDALKASLGDAALLHVVAGQPVEAGQAAPFEGFDPPTDVAEQAGVTSRWLRLTTNVTMGDGFLTAVSLIDANGGAPSAGLAPPTIVRRDWGEAD